MARIAGSHNPRLALGYCAVDSMPRQATLWCRSAPWRNWRERESARRIRSLGLALMRPSVSYHLSYQLCCSRTCPRKVSAARRPSAASASCDAVTFAHSRSGSPIWQGICWSRPWGQTAPNNTESMSRVTLVVVGGSEASSHSGGGGRMKLARADGRGCSTTAWCQRSTAWRASCLPLPSRASSSRAQRPEVKALPLAAPRAAARHQGNFTAWGGLFATRSASRVAHRQDLMSYMLISVSSERSRSLDSLGRCR